MALRGSLALLTLLAATSLLNATTAFAATEVGDECEGNDASGPYSLVPEQHASGGTLPLSAPSDGIVTGWKINSAHGAPVTERIAIFRPTDVTGRFEAVTESDPVTIQPGLNLLPARVAARAGDRFGLVAVGTESPLACITAEVEDHAWSYPGSVEAGSTQQFAAGAFERVPLIAIVEPDADGDGYGDETQDGCPQSAAFSGPCPSPVTLKVRARVRKRSILLEVRTETEADVLVYGQVGWNFKPKPKGRAGRGDARPSRKGTRRLIVGLDGGTKRVAPGAVTRFTIKLPKPVLLRLGRLTRRESVRAKLTLAATNAVGVARNTRLRVKLRGWRKSN
ncbi:MAG TPA: hypothetical protein VG898_05130 [Solirubrobacterales bacterium]|nr:hypothetical protein [Solirubrobacterales bacterium]